MMAWILAHWLEITVAIAIAISVLNAATKHWSEHTGFVRVALFISEVLSILTSRGSTLVGPIKPPLISVPPKTIDPGKVDGGVPPKVVLLLLLPLLGACAGWQKTTLKSVRVVHELGIGARKIASADVCAGKRKECREAGKRKDCPALESCIAARTAVLGGLTTLQLGLSATIDALIAANKSDAATAIAQAFSVAGTICRAVKVWAPPPRVCSFVGVTP